ncbi:MAG: kelch repeat-containing protein [Bacteroidia bacterium]
MKKIFTTFIFCFSITLCFSQVGEWVWIHGDSIPNSTGYYGIQGVSSPSNKPRAVYEACEWTDLNGNFWLFGGTNWNQIPKQEFNDLWKYNPTNNEWTWMKGSGIGGDLGNYGIQGIPSPINNPPSRGWGAVSWVDLQGNFWMFGGLKSDSAYTVYNDLWKYDPITNEWTWMKGPNIPNQPGIYGIIGVPNVLNYPRSRCETAISWTDNNGDLWLFGGSDSLDFLNDLWRYNIVTNTWTWMKGSSSGNQPSFYGTESIEDPANTPGGRRAYSKWKDDIGNFWLFNGWEYGTSKSDMWRFNPITNNWAWMGGDTIINFNGIYGTQCVASTNNVPPVRIESRAVWKDLGGNFWFYGGYTLFPLNDLWKYCLSTQQWTWISGDSTFSFPFVTNDWGMLGVSSPSNKPLPKGGALGWTNNNVDFYLFGGISGISSFGVYNDLWKYTIDTTCGVCPTSTNIAEKNSPNHLFIFPNPSSNELIISNFQFQPNDEIIITDVLGEIIFRKKITEPTANCKLQTANWASGIYFVEVITDEGKVVKKIVKQ